MKHIRAIVTSFVGIFLIFLLIIVFVTHFTFAGSKLDSCSCSFSEDWRDDEGKKVVLNELQIVDGDRFVTISHRVDGSKLNGESLCLSSHNVLFNVYANDELIYDFHPELGGFVGKYYGTYVHTVSLPALKDGDTLRLECELLETDKWKGFENVKLQQSGEYISDIFKENFGKFLICFVMFIFGLILFIFAAVESFVHGSMFETMCLGIVTMLLSVWTHSQTQVLHILTGNTTVLRIIEYSVLCLLPIPMMMFISEFTNNRGNNLVRADIICCLVNFIMQFILVPLGVKDYVDLLIISHILIIISALISVYITRNAVKNKKIDKKQCRYLLTSFTIIVASGMLDMVRYYINASHDAAEVTRIGLFVFVIVLAYYELMQLINVRVKSRESEVMEKLAMEDTLTGMQNRTAFTAYEKKMLERSSGSCLFIHFDVNCLKKVNDSYGHAEGDKHIIAAANVIQSSFGAKGKCFRVGGDEFFAVLDGENFRDDYENGLVIFKKMQQEYNSSEDPPVKLSIAHGATEYKYALKDTESAIRTADSLMYEDKQHMKAVSMP